MSGSVTRVAINGALGEMGGKTAEKALGRDDVELVVGFHHLRESSGESFDVVTADSFSQYADRIDAVIDFSCPEGTMRILEECCEFNVPLVIGTTGFSDDEIARIQDGSSAIPIVKATNFSRGIQSVLDVLGSLVSSLPQYDIEIVETHHNRKTDAPSGTAKTIVELINEDGDYSVVNERVGERERKEDEIGLFSRRAGSIHGEHEVMFAGNNEVVTLSHRAEDRSVFAVGAIDSAVWLQEASSGLYGFEEVVG